MSHPSNQIIAHEDVDLPEGWLSAKLKDVLGFTKGKKPDELKGKQQNFTIPYINIEAFEKKIVTQFTNDDRCPRCIPSDVLVVWDGARCGLVGMGAAGVIGSTLARLDNYGINPKYLFYFLQTRFLFINTQPRGVGIPHVEPSIFWSMDFPLAPLPEQDRIVLKLEYLFTKLDACIGMLENAKMQLKQYRRSVLRAAFSGELTNHWKTTQRNLQSAAELLRQIKAQGYGKTDSHQQGVRKPNATADTIHIPKDWELTLSNDLFLFITSGSRGWARYYSDDGAIFIRITNLDHYTVYLDFKSIQRVNPPAGAEGKRTSVKPNDILVSVTADVGMIAVVPEDIEEAYVNQHIALARPKTGFNVKYVAWYLASEDGGLRQFRQLQRGMTKAGLGLDDIRNIWVPFPAKLEQDRIVEEIERQFSTADSIERTIDSSSKQAKKLQKSILKSAFEGELVSQNPRDEPASILLQRIQTEKNKQQQNIGMKVKPKRKVK